MSENTKIEWADHTFNPWIGCTKVGPGCDNCYAKAEFDDRRHRAVWGAGQPRSQTKTWGDPVRWNKQADAFFAAHGRRQRVFCASLADVFDNEVPSDWRTDLWNLIAATPNLDWLVLTKRIGNAIGMLPAFWAMGPAPHLWESDFKHVWLGATICNQEEADRDIPKLLAVPAAKRFLSMEPLLGPVDLTGIGRYTNGSRNINALMGAETRGILAMSPSEGGSMVSTTFGGPRIDWVIVGGESGPNARPMHPDWARSLRDQCQAAGVPFLFKQWGEWAPHQTVPGGDEGGDLRRGHVRYLQGDGREPDGHFRRGDAAVARVGKKAAGRLLDGREWNRVPA